LAVRPTLCNVTPDVAKAIRRPIYQIFQGEAMDRLAVHVIATAALTVTLATVPVLFADTCHASSAVPPTATRAATHASSSLAPAPAVVAVLPALAHQAQTQAAAAAPADAAFAPPAAAGAA